VIFLFFSPKIFGGFMGLDGFAKRMGHVRPFLRFGFVLTIVIGLGSFVCFPFPKDSFSSVVFSYEFY